MAGERSPAMIVSGDTQKQRHGARCAGELVGRKSAYRLADPAEQDRRDLVHDNPRGTVERQLFAWSNTDAKHRGVRLDARDRTDRHAVYRLKAVTLDDDRRARFAREIAAPVGDDDDITTPHQDRSAR